MANMKSSLEHRILLFLVAEERLSPDLNCLFA